MYIFVGDGLLKKGQKVSHKQAITFFTKTTENVLKLSSLQANIAFTLCKSTVKRENEESAQYFTLDFVEFLELIARVADIKF